MDIFRDRAEAGKLIAYKLKNYKDDKDIIVIGLSRAGIPVAYQVAAFLNAPLDIFSVKRITLPGNDKVEIGNIASDGYKSLNYSILHSLDISQQFIDNIIINEQKGIRRTEELYRGSDRELDLKDKKVILIDDGLSSLSVMKSAISALKRKSPKKLIVAVPVAEHEKCAELKKETDDAICVFTTSHEEIDKWYRNFEQVSDEQVISLLKLLKIEKMYKTV